MITNKIKALFEFIEFLHSNTDNFKQYDGVIKELRVLGEEREKVNQKKNFNDKLKFDEIQAEIKDSFKVIQENIISPIKSKAIELNVCNFKNEPLYSWHGVETEIHNLKENFRKEDLPEIFNYKNQYIEYRTKTNCTYFQEYFFDELDEVLKELFDYFKDSEQNEFESFETKTIQVNNIREAIELSSTGQKKFTFSSNLQPTQNTANWKTHEKLFDALIFSANEEQKKPIAGAFWLLKEVWFFIHSDKATFNGKEVEKYKRPLYVNPVITGNPEFDKFLEAEITYCSTQNRIKLIDQDFMNDMNEWIEQRSKDKTVSIARKRKYNEFLTYLISKKTNDLGIKKEQDIEHPFSSQENYDLFRYFDQWFKPSGKKAKYTYILEHFQDNREKQIMEKPFFDFIEKYTNNPITKRKHSSANNPSLFEILKKLENDFIQSRLTC